MKSFLSSRRVQGVGLLAVFSIILSSIPSSLVLATSPYDSAVRTTNNIIIDSPAYAGSKDITRTWFSGILNGDNDLRVDSTCTQLIKDSLMNSANDGSWSISQFNETGEGKKVIVYWRNDQSGSTYFTAQGGVKTLEIPTSGLGAGYRSAIFYQYGNNNYAVTCTNGLFSSLVSSESSSDIDFKVLLSTFSVNYPLGYEGMLVPSGANDGDSDELEGAREILQGTSDTDNDTDDDGLSDYIESQWNPDRDDIFCGTSCAYPNPASKDLYVEIDWMKDGNRTIKPSANQLAAVATSFANQGIAAHFDTGQYGGGNELPVYTNELYFEPDANNLDFFDLKNGNSTYTANFNPDRDYIWHYMISGYKAKYWDTDNNQWITSSSGVAYGGDDDILIATGHIEDDQASFNYTNLDTALSGTIIHEIGHSICLTQNIYTGQSTGCQFNKIDTWANQSYDSVMNYTHQMFQVDYSNGVNGSPDDHDDWTAVLNGGLKDFTDANHNSGDSAGVQSFTKTKKEKVVRGITSSEAKALKKAGKLGGKYKNHNN